MVGRLRLARRGCARDAACGTGREHATVEVRKTVRTTIVIAIGVALAVAFHFAAAALARRRAGRSPGGAHVFLWAWLAFSLADFGIGVAAGHGAALELAIHALVFAAPAGVAILLARRRGASDAGS